MKMEESSPNGRKHCGKRRNCLLQAISPFRTVFLKDFYFSHVKTRIWERIKRQDSVVELTTYQQTIGEEIEKKRTSSG